MLDPEEQESYITLSKEFFENITGNTEMGVDNEYILHVHEMMYQYYPQIMFHELDLSEKLARCPFIIEAKYAHQRGGNIWSDSIA